MKKSKVVIIILCFFVIFTIFWVSSYKEQKENLITNQTEQINNLKQQLTTNEQKINLLNQQSKTNENNISNLTFQLETKQQYLDWLLDRIDKEITFCQNDSDCVKGSGAGCGSKAVNKRYIDLWEKIQEPTFNACGAVFDGLYAICENNTCINSELRSCKEQTDCKAYDSGCFNKDYFARVNYTGDRESNKWICECSNNQCGGMYLIS